MDIPVINISISDLDKLEEENIIDKEGPLNFSDTPDSVTSKDYYRYTFWKITTLNKQGESENVHYVAVPLSVR